MYTYNLVKCLFISIFQEAGDFASVAYFVLKNRCPDKGSLSIEEVNKDLDAIAVGNAAKNRESVRRHLADSTPRRRGKIYLHAVFFC